jgi:FMN phosphatase YigB (HAD superfamily)
MMKKTMLVDADGVLFNWEYAFNLYMEEHGFKEVKGARLLYNIGERYNISNNQGHTMIRHFNESAMIGFLPALRDAVEYVTKLADEGWQFICITSLSKNKYAQKLRKKNLDKVFGEGTFKELICLGTGADKDKVLEQFEGSNLWWIEDKVENAQAGANVGLRPLVMEHGYNMHDDSFTRVKNWGEIYDIVTGENK